jgi:hypothetical protein
MKSYYRNGDSLVEKNGWRYPNGNKYKKHYRLNSKCVLTIQNTKYSKIISSDFFKRTRKFGRKLEENSGSFLHVHHVTESLSKIVCSLLFKRERWNNNKAQQIEFRESDSINQWTKPVGTMSSQTKLPFQNHLKTMYNFNENE